MIFDDAIDAIREEIKAQGSLYACAKHYGINETTMRNWMSGKSNPTFRDIAGLLDTAGWELRKKEEMQAVELDTPDGLRRIDGYVAYPIAKDASDISEGPLPASNIKGYTIVEADYEAVVGKTNLIVFEATSDCMAPMICKGDYVLIDRDNRVPKGHTDLWLVKSPDGALADLRRLILSGDVLTMWSDDRQCEARAYSVQEDYRGDIRNAVIGRATWMRKQI